MNTKITVIVDNKRDKSKALGSEWGLALLIEHTGKKILLDTGGSDLFLKNMRKLGTDVAGSQREAFCGHNTILSSRILRRGQTI